MEGAAIRVVVQNVLSISWEEIILFLGFKKDLRKLRDSFLMVRDFLHDAELQQVTNRAVKRWLTQLENVAFEVDDLLDELQYEVLRKKMDTQNKMKNKVKFFFSNSNSIVRRGIMAHRIRDINNRLKLINKEAIGFALQMRLLDVHASGAGSSDTPADLESDSVLMDSNSIIVGRERDVSEIVEMLISSPAEQMFSILPIVEMGGSGKTTLAKLVFGDERIISHFEKRIWVHVTKKFDAVVLFKKILGSLTTENFKVESKEELLKRIQNYLGDKRCLLVLDDLWNEDMEVWDNFMDSLRGISFKRGNGIIVTTRSEKAASIVNTLGIHGLKSLTEDDCWLIIKSKAFGEADVPLKFETMGKYFARRCQGLPIAAKVVGGLLRGKSEDEWLSIKETWLSDFGGGESTVMKTLKLSFDHMQSPSLKKCFAYCSIFPKQYWINSEELIELWMAEGFLQTDERNDMETVGNKFINLLAQNSLLQVFEGGGRGNIKYCTMHDLVHDLARSVSGSRNISVNDPADIYQARYIGWESARSGFHIPKEQARCLRTLFFRGNFSDLDFSTFKCLHALVLKGEDVKELPNSIRELIHLRCLDTSYTRIECFPDSIGDLYHLQTLRTVPDTKWKTYYLRKLPDTLKYLINLRNLHIPLSLELPPEIGRLTSLQTLRCFRVGHENGHRINELGSLKNLKGKLEILNLEKVHDKEEARSANLFQKSNILELKLVWDESRESMVKDEKVLEGLQPHPKLKNLEIHGFSGRRFPLWTLKMAVRDDLEGSWLALENLMEMRLTSCKNCKEIPMLGHLPHLKSLYLCGLANVRCIGSPFYGIDDCRTSSGSIILFRALERLELSDMPNLTEWVEVSAAGAIVFPCLEYLKIENCSHLLSAPSHFPCLKELFIYNMDSDLPLANICRIKSISLTKLIIRGLDGLECLPYELISNCPNLSKFDIIKCPKLSHLFPCFGGSGASLRELKILGCLNLRELPADLHNLSSLEILSIMDCPNLESIPYPNDGQSRGFTSIIRLEIHNCKGLTNFPIEMLESGVLSLGSLRLCGLRRVNPSD